MNEEFAPAAWRSDPSGRFQFRYWDGGCWTDHVSTAGSATEDPLPSQPPPLAAPNVLRRTRLTFEYSGPNAKAGMVIWDDKQESVATVPWQKGIHLGGREYSMVDSAGQVLLIVREPKVASNRYQVVDDLGTELAYSAPPVQLSFARKRPFHCEICTAQGPIADLAFAMAHGTIEDISITDKSERVLATVTQSKQQLSMFSTRGWFSVARVEDLGDPLRLLVLAVPLLIHSVASRTEAQMQDGTSSRSFHPL